MKKLSENSQSLNIPNTQKESQPLKHDTQARILQNQSER